MRWHDMADITIYAPGATVEMITITNAPLYPADATPAFQAAVNTLPAYGGKISIAAAALPYLIGGITCGGKAVEWVGEGGPGQSSVLGHGATELMVKDGTVGITFGTTGNQFRGGVLSNLRLVAQSPAALGGLLFNGISNARLNNVTCSNFNSPGAFGRKYNGGASGGSLTMYNEEYGCQANNCTVGVWGVRSNGLLVMGGLYDANDNHSAITPNTTGILWDAPGDTLHVIGARFQAYARHIDNNCEGLIVQGTRHENFTIGIRSVGNYCRIEPGEMTNYGSGASGGTGILVAGNRNYVNAQGINSVALRVDRTGATNSIVVDDCHIYGVVP